MKVQLGITGLHGYIKGVNKLDRRTNRSSERKVSAKRIRIVTIDSGASSRGISLFNLDGSISILSGNVEFGMGARLRRGRDEYGKKSCLNHC